jgi:chromosome segregation ATPase
MTVDHQFNLLNEKLQLLLRQHNRVQKENERLKQELDEARGRELQVQQRIDDLEQQISILKLGAGEMNEKDKKEFEKKINGYLRDVDKCIAFLSS